MKNTCDLTINKEGQYTTFSESDTQCGKTGEHSYRYFVSITATNKNLTEEGFVMDNKLIDDYFQQKYTKNKKICLSCEIMAMEAIESFKNLLAQLTKADVKRIYVRIYGTQTSFIEAEWKKSKKWLI